MVLVMGWLKRNTLKVIVTKATELLLGRYSRTRSVLYLSFYMCLHIIYSIFSFYI